MSKLQLEASTTIYFSLSLSSALIAVSSSRTDTEAELDLVCSVAKAAGAFDAVRCTHWAEGGAGAVALGHAVQRASEAPSNFKFLYGLEVQPISFPSLSPHVSLYIQGFCYFCNTYKNCVISNTAKLCIFLSSFQLLIKFEQLLRKSTGQTTSSFFQRLNKRWSATPNRSALLRLNLSSSFRGLRCIFTLENNHNIRKTVINQSWFLFVLVFFTGVS